ncbi:MAG: hypothetical protein Q9208_006588 [Pyrenodesmia sp. 3 TL-2023]
MAPAAPPKETAPNDSSKDEEDDRLLRRLQKARQRQRQRQSAASENVPFANDNDEVFAESSTPGPESGLRRTLSYTDLDAESSEAKRQRLDEGAVLEARDKRITELEEQVAALTAERDRLTAGVDPGDEEDAATDEPATIQVTQPVLSITAPRLPDQNMYKCLYERWEDGPLRRAEKERRLLFPMIDELAQFEANLGTLQFEGDFGYRVRWTLETWRSMIFRSFDLLCRLEARRLECRYAVTYRASHPLAGECPGEGPREWRDWLAAQAEEKELVEAFEAEMEKGTEGDNAAEDGGSQKGKALDKGAADPGKGETVSEENISGETTVAPPHGRDAPWADGGSGSSSRTDNGAACSFGTQ